MVDSEILMALLKKKGFSFTEDLRFARVFIINTCAFIESAKQESIDAILEAASFKEKKSDNGKLLIVTGCLSQRYPNELRKEIPQIDAVFGTSDFVKIPQFICHSEARMAEESNKILRRHGVYPERSRRGAPQNDIGLGFMDLIVTHNNADFDAFGSAIAACKLYPNSKILLPGSQEQMVRRFLSLSKDKIRVESERTCDFSDIDRLIIVDTRHKSRIGQAKE